MPQGADPQPVCQDSCHGGSIPLQTAQQLRNLVLGADRQWDASWQQPFVFTEVESLGFGLFQNKGGPCGVISAVNAYVVKHLLHCPEPCNIQDSNQIKSRRVQALASAISEMLWRCGGQTRAVVALPLNHTSQQVKGRDVITEGLTLFTLECERTLERFVSQNIHMFMMHGGIGVIWFLCSALLSHGTEQVRSEMDMPDTPLIGRFGYCSQELMNLLLVGRAVSNMWDGDKTLGEGKDVMHLGGVHQRAQVGQLTLFEAYGSMEVGSFLKNPEVPIWVICSESHFTVLFSVERSFDSSAASFELYYYDELVRQTEVIRFSIEPGTKPSDPESDPPLELVIGTKWKNPSVNWNGAEILL